jgi:predicted negative regulator of RcsB-dependent stress response
MFNLLLICILTTYNFADDYIYDYVGNNGKQLSIEEKEKFFYDYDAINKIEDKLSLGEYKDGYKLALILQNKSQNRFVISKAIILQYKAILKENILKNIIKHNKPLKMAIESDLIVESDIIDGYILYIKYLIRLNRLSKAKQYASKIIKTYSEVKYKEQGFISMAKIYIALNNLNNAQYTLNKILKDTTSIKTASIAASIQFDIYIKKGKKKKAKKMIDNIAKYNINYLLENPNQTIKHIQILFNKKIYDSVINITSALLKKNKNNLMTPKYLYYLANSQLVTNNFKDAKENFLEIIHNFKDSQYSSRSIALVDEILLRTDKADPQSLLKIYKDSATMRQKIFMYELITLFKNKQYETILNQKEKYKHIALSIVQRFGYDTIANIILKTKYNLVKEYLKTKEYVKLHKFIKNNNDIFDKLILNKKLENLFLDFISKIKYQYGFDYLYKKYKKVNNQDIIYKLEHSAMLLEEYTKALELSLYLETISSNKLKQKEIIDRFIIVNNLEDLSIKNDFFKYLEKNMWLIKDHTNYMVTDILYQYYQYLEELNDNKSLDILEQLYKTQNNLNVYAYSPFVEIELSTVEYETSKYQNALDILDNVEFKYSTKAKNIHRYYYLKSKIFNKLNKESEAVKMIKKCIDSNGESMWKELCKKVEAIDARK